MEKDKLLREIKLCLAKNDCESAIKTAQKGYECFKDNCFLNEIAQIYSSQNNRKEAIKYYHKIFKNDKNNLSNIKSLAYNYFRSGDFKKALKFYKLVIDFEPQKSENYFNIGSMYHFLKDRKNAFEYYTFAVNMDSKNLSAINNLGCLYYENKMYKEAIPYFKRAMKISPTHPEAYHHMGVVYREYLKDLDMSKYYLKKAYILDPNYPLNSYQLSLTYKARDEAEEAQKYLEKYKKLKG